MPGRRAQDLTGHHYGLWTVLGRAPDQGGNVRWCCQCDQNRGGCGVIRTVAGGPLKQGRSTGCRRCTTTARHAKNPSLSAHLPKLSERTWPGVCDTCGTEFIGTACQAYCSLKCRPSA